MARTEPADPPAGLAFRRLGPADVAAGERLSAEAGWNQNAADWRHILQSGPTIGYEDGDGRLVASAAILPYGDRLAWICMVLVTPRWRKRGLATALLRRCIDIAAENDWTAGLDATEAGRPVYLPLGFLDCFALSRFMAEPPAVLPVAPTASLRPMTTADLDAVSRLDARAAGTDRSALITHLFERAPEFAWIAGDASSVTGFCLGRDGREADQIGPVTARDSGTAVALAARALAARRDPARRVYVDAVDASEDFCTRLREAGFVRQRGFSRMLMGTSTPPGETRLIHAITGPELS